MNRRIFLKTGISLGALWATQKLYPRSLRLMEDNDSKHAYAPGESISPEVFVLDSDLNEISLVDILNEGGAQVNVLYLYGGGAHRMRNKIGGLWCRDSFEDLHVLRYLHEKYQDSEVKLIPVACPPVYASAYYGFPDRVFLDEPNDSEKFIESANDFVASTQRAISEGYVPVDTYYDFRNRLLFNRRDDLKPGEGYGPVFPWQGKFRSDDETQKYGTPTIWLLESEGMVLENPFYGNIYHSDPFPISYTIIDVDTAVRKHL